MLYAGTQRGAALIRKLYTLFTFTNSLLYMFVIETLLWWYHCMDRHAGVKKVQQAKEYASCISGCKTPPCEAFFFLSLLLLMMIHRLIRWLDGLVTLVLHHKKKTGYFTVSKVKKSCPPGHRLPFDHTNRHTIIGRCKQKGSLSAYVCVCVYGIQYCSIKKRLVRSYACQTWNSRYTSSAVNASCELHTVVVDFTCYR